MNTTVPADKRSVPALARESTVRLATSTSPASSQRERLTPGMIGRTDQGSNGRDGMRRLVCVLSCRAGEPRSPRAARLARLTFRLCRVTMTARRCQARSSAATRSWGRSTASSAGRLRQARLRSFWRERPGSESRRSGLPALSGRGSTGSAFCPLDPPRSSWEWLMPGWGICSRTCSPTCSPSCRPPGSARSRSPCSSGTSPTSRSTSAPSPWPSARPCSC